ncbi:hypothetical protein SANTM175S_09483 [Streptomyces antimycoticus]
MCSLWLGSGTGSHEADFHDYRLGEGSAVWIRPGMVHRWSDIDACDGPLVLFRPGFLSGFTASEASTPACWHLDQQRLSLALFAAEHLGREHSTAVHTPRLASPALLSHLLAALILRALPDTPPPTGAASPGSRPTEVFHAYRTTVEERFTEWHHVADYARALGYDVRTLTRATRAATGTGAKTFLDQRILLEAKRLLAHTDLPVSGCALTPRLPGRRQLHHVLPAPGRSAARRVARRVQHPRHTRRLTCPRRPGTWRVTAAGAAAAIRSPAGRRRVPCRPPHPHSARRPAPRTPGVRRCPAPAPSGPRRFGRRPAAR